MRAGIFDKFGVKALFTRSGQAEMEYYANKVIIEAIDWKGLNVRGVGWTGFVLAEPEFRASGIVIPSADVYTALQTGVIDAMELGGPFGSITGGYYEVVKYHGFPGMHQFSQTTSILINGKKWASLSTDIQKILEEICTARNIRTYAFNLKENAQSLDFLENYGIQFVRESPACQRAWRDVSWRLADKFGAKEARFKEHWDSMKAYILFLRPYLEMQTPYMGKKMTTIGLFKWADLKKELK